MFPIIQILGRGECRIFEEGAEQVLTKKEMLVLPTNEIALKIFGQKDSHLRLLENSFSAEIIARGNEVTIQGSEGEVEKIKGLIEELQKAAVAGNHLSPREVNYAIQTVLEEGSLDLYSLYSDVIHTTYRGKKIKPKTVGQKAYVDAIRKKDIVFGIGPAGTGKTYLALVMAVRAFLKKEVARIVLARPAIEAGEKLGFLPGDLQEKVDPYLRPLYDALYDVLGHEAVFKYLERDVIEVAPLAYMRGRTLDDSFVILDEAQNTTKEQMKMFLTRLGFRSKAVITGDVTQIDLPRDTYSGLNIVRNILADIKGIDFVYLTNRDVIRHSLVQEILKAYDLYEKGEG